MARLFVALWPDEAVLARLAQLPRPEIEGLRWTTRDQWHVTLQFLGEAPQDEMATRLGRERWGLEPFRVRVGPRTTLLGGENVVLPATGSGLDRLAGRVPKATGVDRRRPFRGHLTLARARNRVSKSGLSAQVGKPFDAEWTVERLALVRSTLAPDGARYETVAEFDL